LCWRYLKGKEGERSEGNRQTGEGTERKRQDRKGKYESEFHYLKPIHVIVIPVQEV